MQKTLPSATTLTAIIECVNGHNSQNCRFTETPHLPGPEQERGNRCHAARYSQHPPPKINTHTYQCCGSGMFIPDPNFFHPGSRIRIKEFRYFNQKNCFLALGNMIRVVHSGSGLWFFTHPGSRGQKGTGSRIRDTETVSNRYRCCVSALVSNRIRIQHFTKMRICA